MGSLAFVILCLFVAVVVCVNYFYKLNLNAQRLENNFDKYKADHPDCVFGGRVKCYECGSQRVNARGLMNQTYTREHFCVQCGKTLYYSPENNI